MYRVSRAHDGLQFLYPSLWYLNQAYQTYMAMFPPQNAPYYTQFGLMEGSVFLDLMNDLQFEGLTEEFQQMKRLQQQRLAIWVSLPAPYGSEMPWDSTGQEEIWSNANYFNDTRLQHASLAAILAYTHLMPHWAYHGSSRRYWDFWINGAPKYTMPNPEVQHRLTGQHRHMTDNGSTHNHQIERNHTFSFTVCVV